MKTPDESTRPWPATPTVVSIPALATAATIPKTTRFMRSPPAGSLMARLAAVSLLQRDFSLHYWSEVRLMSESALQPLNRLVGNWVTEATHPALPGAVVRGTTAIEWLEGQRFLVVRSHNDHQDFPDAISIVGFTDVDRVGADADQSTAGSGSRLCMHYFDARGVFRVYE